MANPLEQISEYWQLLAGGIGSVIAWKAGAKKQKAEVSTVELQNNEIVQEIYQKLLADAESFWNRKAEAMEQQITRLETELKECKTNFDEYRKRIERGE